ncbi:DUF4910 domain-containing protein [Candidatus Pacearchaeota archaeon]|nr:DUF4910 domain-containing protein [Candidatus Pacearchaeota archaeon]
MHMSDINQLIDSMDKHEVGNRMCQLMSDLYPICRSITGNGVRESLAKVKEIIPLQVHEVPSETQVFDWTVPREWNIKDAYVKNSKGERVIDFRKSNLHVLGYSTAICKKVSLKELKDHLFTVPDHPDWIPYRTTYYREDWGFCVSHNQLSSLEEDTYEVCIDSTLQDGHLTYGEYYIKGQTSDEVLLSTHICHPSLCNDNLSGIVLVAFLARYLSEVPLRYSYRFLFVPATIGAITWLCLNEERVPRIKHGLVAACVGDPGKLSYKKSRRGEAEIDRAVALMFKHSKQDFQIRDFAPYGYDERQFCSPGFDLPVGSLTRTPNGCYPEYHTSADNLDFVRPESLTDSMLKYLVVLRILEHNKKYMNKNPKGEPQLGRRGIYRAIGGAADLQSMQLAMLWVLNLSDGKHDLLDIAERAEMDFDLVRNAADILLNNDLLEEYRD